MTPRIARSEWRQVNEGHLAETITGALLIVDTITAIAMLFSPFIVLPV